MRVKWTEDSHPAIVVEFFPHVALPTVVAIALGTKAFALEVLVLSKTTCNAPSESKEAIEWVLFSCGCQRSTDCPWSWVTRDGRL